MAFVAGTLSLADVVDGYLYAAGSYWESYNWSPGQFANMDVATAGVQGVGVKHGGFRGRKLVVKACFVSGSDSACQSALITAITALEDIPFSVTLPSGDQYQFCYLVGGAQDGNPKHTGHATYSCTVTLMFDQKAPNP